MSAGSLLYDDARRATLDLVAIRSISPSRGERDAAEAVLRLLREGDLAYDAIGLQDLPGDPFRRANAYALLRGRSPDTVVLTGHLDTVGTEDYGDLEAHALDPRQIAARRSVPAGWLAGRGIADMKSGVGAMIAVLRHLARLPRAQRPLSVLLAATPDEENESAGMRALPDHLLALRDAHGLRLAGAINTDVTTPAAPGDPYRYVYTGTIGKLLPSYYVVGVPAHAGGPEEGLDANLLAAELIRDVSMARDLRDAAGDTVGPPPVTLHAADLKSGYNTQIPYEATFSLNVLTLSRRPDEVLALLADRARRALDGILAAVTAERCARGAGVLTYAALVEAASGAVGKAEADRRAAETWRMAAGDQRDRSLAMVRRLFAAAGLSGPAAVLYLAPPYYPHLPELPSPLSAALRAVAAEHAGDRVAVREFFPLLSDMSYLRLDPDLDIAVLDANMPAWRPDGYTLPLETIRALDIPVVNIGPHGEGIHRPDERVLESYAFGVVPRLILETIARLAG